MAEKDKNKKAGLKFNIHKTEIMASCPIISCKIYEEKVEMVVDFIFAGSKITAGGDCNHKIKRCLLLGRKAMMNLDSVLKSKDVNYADKDPHSQSYVLPVVMYGC